jgi:hypothetical protein
MPGMLQLADVFKFIIDTFDQSSFSEHNLIGLGDIKVLHVLTWLGDHLDAVSPK